MTDVETTLRVKPDIAHVADAAARRFTEAVGPATEVAYSEVDSPIGKLLLAATPTGVLRIGFDGEPRVLENLAARVSPRILEYPARLSDARRELDEYFAGRRSDFTFPLDWALIDGFRREVLTATAGIPYGAVATYQEISHRAGRPKGARATGQALAGNPIPVVIPCHRVLRTGGGLGGYAGGTDRKEFLLRLEGAVL
jgi:methylated-DNA-[protein]-cysteine S-methyltransferase